MKINLWPFIWFSKHFLATSKALSVFFLYFIIVQIVSLDIQYSLTNSLTKSPLSFLYKFLLRLTTIKLICPDTTCTVTFYFFKGHNEAWSWKNSSTTNNDLSNKRENEWLWNVRSRFVVIRQRLSWKWYSTWEAEFYQNFC